MKEKKFDCVFFTLNPLLAVPFYIAGLLWIGDVSLLSSFIIFSDATNLFLDFDLNPFDVVVLGSTSSFFF